MTQGKLSLHIKPFSSQKNAAGIVRNPTSIVLTYHHDGEIGTLDRILKHRGISFAFLATRSCSEAEFKEEYEPYWRYRFLHYANWDLLFADEQKFVQDGAFDATEWFRTLEQIRSEWPHLESRERKTPAKPFETAEQWQKRFSKLLTLDPQIRLDGF